MLITLGVYLRPVQQLVGGSSCAFGRGVSRSTTMKAVHEGLS